MWLMLSQFMRAFGDLVVVCVKSILLQKRKKNQHRSLEHRYNGKEPVICELCGKEVFKKLLKRHMASAHNIGNPACKICGAEFPDNFRLNLHIEKVHEDGITCDKCGKKFTNKIR